MNADPPDIEPETPEPEIPDGLAADLRALATPAAGPGPSVDAAVLAAARERLAPPPVSRWRRPVTWVPLAAAAAVLATWSLLAGGMRADLDGNGRVDVLDAFLLARALRDGAADDPRFDVNGDGVIDERDVDHISAEATRL